MEKRPENKIKKYAVTAAKFLLALAVVYFTGRQLAGDIASVDYNELEISYAYLALGAMAYGLAMSVFSVFWKTTVGDMGGNIGFLDALRGFVISQPGKYVPGKALGIVIRCAVTDSRKVTPLIAAISSFFETFSLMGCASLVAFVALVGAGVDDWRLLATSAGLLVLLGTLVQPPVFSKVLKLVALPFKKAGDNLADPVKYSTLGKGALAQLAGWLIAGLGTMLTAKGVGIDLVSWHGALLCLAGTTLSISGGFVMIFVPAGLGVREYIFALTLAQLADIDKNEAALIAVATRLTYVVVEIAYSLILLPIKPGIKDDNCSRPDV